MTSRTNYLIKYVAPILVTLVTLKGLDFCQSLLVRTPSAPVPAMFAALSSEDRLKILDELSGSDRRFAELKRNIDTTSPQLVRQLGRLSAAHLVFKRRSGSYAISPLGVAVRSMMASLEFVAQHSGYFRSHDTSPVPDFLLRQLDIAMRAEDVVEKFGPLNLVMERGNSIREFYWIISDSIPRFVLPQVKRKIRQGVKFKALYPREYLSQVRPTLDPEIIRNVEFRVANEVKIIVCVTDQFGYVCLPKSGDQEIDRRHFIFGQNLKFRNWCEKLFAHYWNKAS
jgi:predicted transcriptional regulator